MLELIKTIDVKNTLGESVIWDDVTQSVWWTDIEEKCLYIYRLADNKLTRLNTPHRLCAFGLLQDSSIMIAAFDKGIGLFDYRTGKIDWLFKLPADAAVRFNDGRVDAQGRFWVGTLNEGNDATDSSGLYQVDTYLTVTRIESGVGICNGLGWNVQQTNFYMADSSKQIIYKYCFDRQTGNISNKRVLKQFEKEASPDGAIVDADSNLWSALWGGNCLTRISEDGQESRFQLPVSQPTCVAFGGPDRDLLFVTSARYGLNSQELEEQPNAGSLLIYRTEAKGIESPYFLGKGFCND